MKPLPQSPLAEERPSRGRTLVVFSAEQPEDVHPDYWEMHPDGDEFLYAWSGRLAIDLENDAGSESVTLATGTGHVVPSCTWHRIRLLQPAILMAITHRDGTQRRKHSGT